MSEVLKISVLYLLETLWSTVASKLLLRHSSLTELSVEFDIGRLIFGIDKG